MVNEGEKDKESLKSDTSTSAVSPYQTPLTVHDSSASGALRVSQTS